MKFHRQPGHVAKQLMHSCRDEAVVQAVRLNLGFLNADVVSCGTQKAVAEMGCGADCCAVPT